MCSGCEGPLTGTLVKFSCLSDIPFAQSGALSDGWTGSINIILWQHGIKIDAPSFWDTKVRGFHILKAFLKIWEKGQECRTDMTQIVFHCSCWCLLFDWHQSTIYCLFLKLSHHKYAVPLTTAPTMGSKEVWADLKEITDSSSRLYKPAWLSLLCHSIKHSWRWINDTIFLFGWTVPLSVDIRLPGAHPRMPENNGSPAPRLSRAKSLEGLYLFWPDSRIPRLYSAEAKKRTMWIFLDVGPVEEGALFKTPYIPLIMWSFHFPTLQTTRTGEYSHTSSHPLPVIQENLFHLSPAKPDLELIISCKSITSHPPNTYAGRKRY